MPPCSRLLFLFVVCLCSVGAQAGPPFLTDDPEPVPYCHYEFYLFSTLDRLHGGSSIAVPAFEFNVGAAPNLQLHVVAPMALAVQNDTPTAFGLGDVELGAKVRFIQEAAARPQVGVFVMLELPTGNNHRRLGNGQLWAKVPVWMQKSWGPWTTYGGGGYVINRARDMRDHPFFGWQIQRALNEKVTIGAEWFHPGREGVGIPSTNILNAGGFYNVNQNLSVLATVGHSVQGDSHTVAYLGLYWTWGASGSGESNLTAALSSGGSGGRRD